MRQLSLDHFNSEIQAMITNWHDNLDSNLDDLVNVDGEEGDFGIIVYRGTDRDGNKDVHLSTEYIKGGDVETVVLTLAGCDVVQKLIQDHYQSALRKQLEQLVDPGIMYNMKIGWVKEAEADHEKYKDMATKINNWGKQQNMPMTVTEGQPFAFCGEYFLAEIEGDQVRLICRTLRTYLAWYEVVDGAISPLYPSGTWKQWLQAFRTHNFVPQDCENENYPK